MKNLYEQLKPEIRDSIQADLEKYPTSTKDLIYKLKSVNFWSELKMGDVRNVILHDHTNLLSISHIDLLWGDKYLLNEEQYGYIYNRDGTIAAGGSLVFYSNNNNSYNKCKN